MTRNDFMAYAEREIDAVINTHKNRLMDVVMRAWAEGKKSAEIDALTETVRLALERMEKKEQKNGERPTVDPIEWFKAWIGEIMMNNNDEPLTQSEILRRIDEGGLKRFIEDYEREKNDDTDK